MGRYGPQFSINLDRQIARVRVQKPMPLDFQALAEGVKKNNMGLGGFKVEAVATIDGDRVTLSPTGQSFRILGAPPAEAGPARRVIKVTGWEDPARTSAEIVR